MSAPKFGVGATHASQAPRRRSRRGHQPDSLRTSGPRHPRWAHRQDSQHSILFHCGRSSGQPPQTMLIPAVLFVIELCQLAQRAGLHRMPGSRGRHAGLLRSIIVDGCYRFPQVEHPPGQHRIVNRSNSTRRVIPPAQAARQHCRTFAHSLRTRCRPGFRRPSMDRDDASPSSSQKAGCRRVITHRPLTHRCRTSFRHRVASLTHWLSPAHCASPSSFADGVITTPTVFLPDCFGRRGGCYLENRTGLSPRRRALHLHRLIDHRRRLHNGGRHRARADSIARRNNQSVHSRRIVLRPLHRRLP